MAAVLENSLPVKREFSADLSWGADENNLSDFVRQHRHTNPDDACIRPTKRACLEDLQSAWHTPESSFSSATLDGPSVSLQGDTFSYSSTCLFGAGTRTAGHVGDLGLGAILRSPVEQGHWPSGSHAQLVSHNSSNVVTASQQTVPEPFLEENRYSVHYGQAHLLDPTGNHSHPYPVSAVELSSASLISYAHVPSHVYPPVHFTCEPSPSHPSPFSCPQTLYDRSPDTRLDRVMTQSELGDIGASNFIDVATAFDYMSGSLSPQETPIGHNIRTVSLGSDTGVSEDQNQNEGWVRVASGTDVVRSHTSGRLFEYAGPQVGPVEMPLGGSFEELGSTEPANYPVGMNVPGMSSQPSPSSCTEVKERKRRGQFSEVDRQATSVTRGVGACMRCRAQRIRCSPSDPNDPSGPCAPCSKVSKTNKKTIHRIPCWRYKFATMILHRSGGLNYTKRFTYQEVVDIGDYCDNIILSVKMEQGLCEKPVVLHIRRFRPREGDDLNRRYIENGTLKEQPLEPFCLANVEQTAKYFRKYVEENALRGLRFAVRESDDIVKATFAMIARESMGITETGRGRGKKDANESKEQQDLRKFLWMVVRLWFSIRHETGSAWLDGPETLPAGSRLPPGERPRVPRMIVAQFDSIRHERIYKDLAPQVLKAIETYICSCNMRAWFTVYLASFLLLHQVSYSSKDRMRWAQANMPPGTPLAERTRYGPRDHPLTALVEYLQESGRSLLLYWQYFKRCDLMNFDWGNAGKSSLKHLKPYQVEFMKFTVERLKRKGGSIPTSPSEGCWEHELFWVSHLFGSPPSKDQNWTPPEGFSRAKPSVGRI
ncbi:hypothetical protein V8F33_002395 [Rhypophila sp. PSN 637]